MAVRRALTSTKGQQWLRRFSPLAGGGTSGNSSTSAVNNNSISTNPLLQSLVKSNLFPAERLIFPPPKPPVHQSLSTSSTLNMANDLVNEAQFTSAQAATILNVIEERLAGKMLPLYHDLYHKSQIESDTQLLKSVYHELKLDLLSKSAKNTLELKNIHEKHSMDCQSFAETLRELANSMKTESMMHLNSYKADNRSEAQKIDLIIHQHSGDLTTAMGDFKTTVESVKLKTTSTFTMSLILIFSAVLGERMYSREQEREKRELQKKTAFDIEQQWPKT